jgi:hypothetical protein
MSRFGEKKADLFVRLDWTAAKTASLSLSECDNLGYYTKDSRLRKKTFYEKECVYLPKIHSENSDTRKYWKIPSSREFTMDSLAKYPPNFCSPALRCNCHLTRQSRKLFEKQVFAQLIQKFLRFYGNLSFITVFKISHHWALYCASWIQFTPSHRFLQYSLHIVFPSKSRSCLTISDIPMLWRGLDYTKLELHSFITSRRIA